MHLHPRHDQVTRADIEISTAICQAVVDHELTFAELVHILAGRIQSWSKMEVGDERAADERTPQPSEHSG